MRTYAVRRLLVALPSLLIASFIVFTLPRLIPGDVVQLMLEEKAYGKDLEDLRAKLGLLLGRRRRRWSHRDVRDPHPLIGRVDAVAA